MKTHKNLLQATFVHYSRCYYGRVYRTFVGSRSRTQRSDRPLPSCNKQDRLKNPLFAVPNRHHEQGTALKIVPSRERPGGGALSYRFESQCVCVCLRYFACKSARITPIDKSHQGELRRCASGKEEINSFCFVLFFCFYLLFFVASLSTDFQSNKGRCPLLPLFFYLTPRM